MTATQEFRVRNLDCDNEAAAIQRGLAGFPGLLDLRVYPKAAKVAVTFDAGLTSRDALAEKLGRLGFPPREDDGSGGPPKPWRNPKVVSSASSGVLLLFGWLASAAGLPAVVVWGAYITAMLVGGYYFGREALTEAIFEHAIGVEFLMAAAALVAALAGHPGEGAMLVFLYSISEAAEGYTEAKSRSAIRALMSLAPKVALLKRGGQEIEVPVEELAVGDIFIVKPGQSIATDGEVLTGHSNVNQAPVTGESVPIEKAPGDALFAASINGEGALEVRTTKTATDNTIARIVHMVEEAQERKGASQRFIERFGARYSPAVLLAGIVLAIVPPLLFGGDWLAWLTRATVFVVAAAPCALVISIPVTMVATLGTAARKGILVKGGVYIEELARVAEIALDKTGTLTRGEPGVTAIIPTPAMTAGEAGADVLLAVAAGIERRSEHPLARAIMDAAAAKRIAPAEVTDMQGLTGAGAAGRLNGQLVYVGSPALFKTRLKLELDAVAQDIERLQAAGNTVILVGTDAAIWGLIAIRDNLRANARRAVAALHETGVKVSMLTGDNERTARAIAAQAGIDEVYADLRPEDKVARIREMTQRSRHVAMVGDGVNDAPALAEASVGIAMGAAGTDVALETADVALMADDLEKLVEALLLARRAQRIVFQNLILSAVLITCLVLGAVSGLFSLPLVVVAHEVSEFIVIGNGLRMLRG